MPSPDASRQCPARTPSGRARPGPDAIRQGPPRPGPSSSSSLDRRAADESAPAYPQSVALTSSAESPVPVREVARQIGLWVGRLGRIWVDGQLTQIKIRPGTNTVFFNLRDPSANVTLLATCPRQVFECIEPKPTEGLRVAVLGKPEFYVPRGSLQLVVHDIRPIGIGDLLARLERLKKILAAEGLFAPERKRPLPFLPRVVGLICGRGSAAERDVVENARRRWPAVRFDIAAVAVQGPYAVPEIVAALRRLDDDPVVDVIVIARGGGSVEDLLPFSDETLLRAVAACRTPVVSAIGHETDTPLLDFVADVAASTPTDAARRIVPDVAEQYAQLAQLGDRLRNALRHRIDREQQVLDTLRSRPVLAHPVQDINRRGEEILRLVRAGRTALDTAIRAADADARHLVARLRALAPAATLERGYAIVLDPAGRVIRGADEVQTGDELVVRLGRGRLRVTVTDVAPAETDHPLGSLA